MRPVGSDSALVVWQQETIPDRHGADLWPVLRESLEADRSDLDAACGAALAGPIRFHLTASQGSSLLLPHLTSLKHFAGLLARRTLLDLHDHRRDEAWTNLLAVTRLVTAWSPEPAEVSHLVRFTCATLAFNATWQVLQAEGWTDDQLARLQAEWQSVRFFAGLPETTAFTRASMAAACVAERNQPLSRPSLAFADLLRSPRVVAANGWHHWRQIRYRHQGSFEDEKALLLHYRDREVEIRAAIQAPTWTAMRALPGVTNLVPFRSRHGSALFSMMNMRQISLRFAHEGGGLLGRAAETEARRRLLIVALAIARYQRQHGAPPDSLQALHPGWLKEPLPDFMDGQPLRYRRTDDGRFVLYSVGLDGVDDGGVQAEARAPGGGGPVPRTGIARDSDLAWPRPASVAEAESHVRRERETEEERARRAGQDWEAKVRRDELARQAAVRRLLASAPPRSGKEPTHQGRPLGEVLRNTATAGETRPRLHDLLTLRPASPPTAEEGMVGFEVPIHFAALTNLGELRLLVDTEPGQSPFRERGRFQECVPATNGNCLLLWNTYYDPPGQHALQAQLAFSGPGHETAEVAGPVLPYFSSNAYYFDGPLATSFGPNGALISFRLGGSNGLYTIELTSPAGEHLKRFSGSTTNGVVRVHWDLVDDQGKAYTDDSLECSIRVDPTGPEALPAPLSP